MTLLLLLWLFVALLRCMGVESVEAAMADSKTQQFSVTKPALLPSGFGDSSFNLVRPWVEERLLVRVILQLHIPMYVVCVPDCLRSLIVVVAIPSKAVVDVKRSRIS